MKHVELFDGNRHELRDVSIALAFDPKGVVALSDPARPYGAEMRVLMTGEHEIGMGESMVFTPDDAALCVGNAKKRMAEHFIPLLYDHGWTARGTEAAGEITDCYERDGDLWMKVDFADEEAFVACCKPGKKWKGRSLGFGAWVDAAGKLRPADPKECSMTNLPRLKGLGPVVSMSTYMRELSSLRPRIFDMNPDALVVAGLSPEGRRTLWAAHDEGSLSPTTTTSPIEASPRKEHEMKFSPEILARLGLAADANEDQINAALAAQLERVATKEKSLAELMKEMDARFDERFRALSEQMAADRVAAEAAAAKKSRVDAILTKAVSLGKVFVGQRDLIRPAVEANPEAFEQQLSTMPVIAPVGQVFEHGDQPGQIAGANVVSLSERSARLAKIASASLRNGLGAMRTAEMIHRQGQAAK